LSNIALLADEQGNIIGQKDRDLVEKGDIVAISTLFLENSKGKILIAQRSLEKKIDPGLWGPSAAGTLEPGETFLSNVFKEAEEEIGLTGIKPEEIHRFHYWRPDGIGRYAVWYRAQSDWPI
jgi:isopentenyldiphosphate isomerase